MNRLSESWLTRRLHRRAERSWSRLHGALSRSGRPLGSEIRDQARELHRLLGDLLRISTELQNESRNSLSRMELPAGTDWRWRPRILQAPNELPTLAAPENGRWLSPEVALFHDCAHRAVILRQTRNRRATDLAEFALALEVMGFSGSYLSFSLALPPEALEGLSGQNVLRLDSVLQSERPITVYARLNVQQGPNTQKMLRQLGDPIKGANNSRVVEFDLGYAELSHRPVEKAWIDLIFEGPHMNAVVLRDIVTSRHLRAQI